MTVPQNPASMLLIDVPVMDRLELKMILVMSWMKSKLVPMMPKIKSLN